ncbi:MAG: hypothetical protein LBB04_00975 [Oscillospiraceae bacterium]|jgi:hypothetical protein|nr:hypothetical protein [Oscillospiraceae bacterium]
MDRKVNEKMRVKQRRQRWVANLLAIFVCQASAIPMRAAPTGENCWLDQIVNAPGAADQLTVNLKVDRAASSTIVVGHGKTVTLNLCGHALYRANNPAAGGTFVGPLFSVSGGGTLIVNGPGAISGSSDVLPSSHYTTGAGSGPLVEVSAKGSLRANKTNFCLNINTKGNGGAIHNEGNIQLKDCNFTSCACVGDGGAIFNAAGASLTVGYPKDSLPRTWYFWGDPNNSEAGFRSCKTAATASEALTKEKNAPTKGYGGAICNEGTCVFDGKLDRQNNQQAFRRCFAFGGACVANRGGTLTLMNCVLGFGDEPCIAYPCAGTERDPNRWGEGNLLWNSGRCGIDNVTFVNHPNSGKAADIFISGNNPIILQRDFVIPDPVAAPHNDHRSLTVAGFILENDPNRSTGPLHKLGVDEPGKAHDFAFFNPNKYGLINPQNVDILSGDMHLALGADGRAHAVGTDKIHENTSTRTGRQLVVAIDPNKTVTGRVTCALFHIFSGKKITTATQPTIVALQGNAGNDADYATGNARQRFLVNLPGDLSPGSYWLVVFEDEDAIGNIHIHLADVAPPTFTNTAVLTAATGGQIITPTDGEYRYSSGTPVITFTLSDSTGVPGSNLASAPKEIKLDRPLGSQPLSPATHYRVENNIVYVAYPVTAPGKYTFEAGDHARNKNSITFTMQKQETLNGGSSDGIVAQPTS